jgi:hypothetical protein
VEQRAHTATRIERTARSIERVARRMPWVRRVALAPVVARPGAWIATAGGLAWGAPLARFRVRRSHGLFVCAGLPRWAFGRGGTTVGSVFLTRDQTGDAVLGHETVHAAQWRRYGLAFPVLYFAAGLDGRRNHFEIEAGLEAGGYVRTPAPRWPVQRRG